MADITASGVYSIEGQDALANELAFGTPEAPEDDGGVTTDGGEAFDSGEGWVSTADEAESWQDHKISPADEAKLEFDAEWTSQFVRQKDAEAVQAEYEQEFQAAVENYAKLEPEEQYQVSLEHVGRGLEAVAPLVNHEQAEMLNQELFAGSADGVAASTTLAFFADNVMQTIASNGIDPSALTPELAQQVTDPAMAQLFAQQLCGALRMPELLQDGIVDPMEMSAMLLPYVPALLSGQSSDLFPREYKLVFAQDVCRAFGQKQAVRQIDPNAAVALFDTWSKWGARLGQGLAWHRQQAQQPQQSRSRSRSAERSNAARPTKSVPWKSNRDLFDEDSLGRYSTTL